MDTEILPRNEHDIEELLAKRLGRGRGYLTKAYEDEDKLLGKYQQYEQAMYKHARKTFEATIEAGKVLFAFRRRKARGEWQPWLDEQGIHYKKADKLIKVAVWAEYFPPLNPDTEAGWSLSAAYDRLPEIKAQVWEAAGGHEDGLTFDDLENPGDLTPAALERTKSRGGKRDVSVTLKRRWVNVYADLAHEVEDMGRSDLAELIVRMQGDLQQLMDRLGPLDSEYCEVENERTRKFQISC